MNKRALRLISIVMLIHCNILSLPRKESICHDALEMIKL